MVNPFFKGSKLVNPFFKGIKLINSLLSLDLWPLSWSSSFNNEDNGVKFHFYHIDTQLSLYHVLKDDVSSDHC
jgi:hypothetical protein